MRFAVLLIACACIRSIECLRTVSTSSTMTSDSTILVPIVSSGHCGFVSHAMPKAVVCAQEHYGATWECFYDALYDSPSLFYPNVTVICQDENLLHQCHVAMTCREPSVNIALYNAWNYTAMASSFIVTISLLLCVVVDFMRCLFGMSSLRDVFRQGYDSSPIFES